MASSPSRTLLVLVVPIIVIGLILIAVVDSDGGGPVEHVTIGFLLGTMFSHATLASAWTALGPLPLIWRLPLSIVWLAAVLIAFMLNVAFHNGAPPDALLMIGGCLVGQWLLTQVPLWGLAIGYGLRVRHARDIETNQPSESQFGIRQLIIITAIAGVVLGIGRAVTLALIKPGLNVNVGGEVVIFIFLAIAGIVMTIPLIVAMLLPRRALMATLAVLTLTAVATTWEVPLLSQITSVGGPDAWHFVFINAFQSLWILAILGVLRAVGYHLAPRRELGSGGSLSYRQ